MRRTFLSLLAIMLLAGSAAAQELSYLSKLPPIIDRDVFFGDPEISGARISPDGKYIAFIKPWNGTRTRRPLAPPEAARALGR